MREVIKFVLVGVRFTLKAHGVIGLLRTSEACPLMQPLRYINEVEAYVSRLFQLGGMDGFVAEGAIRNRSAFPAGKDEAEEIDRSKAAERDEAVVDYFHAG